VYAEMAAGIVSEIGHNKGCWR